MRAGGETDNRQQQKNEHTSQPKAAQPKVEHGQYSQQQAEDTDDNLHYQRTLKAGGGHPAAYHVVAVARQLDKSVTMNVHVLCGDTSVGLNPGPKEVYVHQTHAVPRKARSDSNPCHTSHPASMISKKSAVKALKAFLKVGHLRAAGVAMCVFPACDSIRATANSRPTMTRTAPARLKSKSFNTWAAYPVAAPGRQLTKWVTRNECRRGIGAA
jgi:hypothetical protein